MKEEREVKRNTSYITGQVFEEDDDRCHGDMDRGRLARTYVSREGDMTERNIE